MAERPPPTSHSSRSLVIISASSFGAVRVRHCTLSRWYFAFGAEPTQASGGSWSMASRESHCIFEAEEGGCVHCLPVCLRTLRTVLRRVRTLSFTLAVFQQPPHCTLGTSHTKLLASAWYARVSLPMRSIECSRCLREVVYTYILGFRTNHGMPPDNIFDILVRSALSLLTCARRGSDNAFLTRLYGKYFAVEHTSLQA